ncbi:hypothetical protein PV371_38220 [Streptomyces sp. TX20-6-3]|uniref:hypothetical protein n=1 Tax=Streptomyces sp. TX20-6-3 TaxID=3028705 RepID=UPI0029A2F14D|nr:hypothetical protein [Streptomyces sp. TX20-6-3]MDX2565385.1 hypothetical protein [Streptomyces sp. TX20-6-3]
MTEDERTTLTEVERLRRKARGDRRPTSVPLSILGVVTLLGAVSAHVFGHTTAGMVFWMAAGPMCFLAVAAYYRLQSARIGAGAGHSWYLWTGLLVIPLTVLAPFWGFGGVTVMAFTLTWLAVIQRNTILTICAISFGVVGTLEDWMVFETFIFPKVASLASWNPSGASYSDGISTLVYGILGSSLIAASLVARRREAVDS